PPPPPPPPGPGESGFPANAGDPTVIISDGTVTMNTPFLFAENGTSTTNGPPVILALQNFSGSTADIPLVDVGNVSPTVSDELLSAFEDPNHAGTLLAGVRTRNTDSTSSAVLGGLALHNSIVNASVDVAEFTNANVVVEGAMLELVTSALNVSSGSSLALDNSRLNVSGENAALRVIEGSTLGMSGNVVSLTSNSDVAFASGLLDIQSGGTVNVGVNGSEDILETSGQSTFLSGETVISVDQGSLHALRVSGNTANMNLVITNGGLLTLTNDSQVSIANGFGFAIRNITSASTFVSVDHSQLEMGLNTGGVLARLSESFIVNSGGVLAVDNSGKVSVSSVIRGSGTTDSNSVLNGHAVAVNDQSQVSAIHLVNLDNLITGTDLILNINNGSLLNVQRESTATFETLATLAGSSIVSDETLVVVNDQSTLSMGSVMLSLIAKNDQNGVTRSTITVNNGGILELSNGSRYVDQNLLAASSPLVSLVQSTITASSGFLDVNSGSTLVANVPNDALVSLNASTLAINGSLVSVAGVNSSVAVTGNLVSLTNGSALTITNGFLVSVLDGGSFSLNGALANFGVGGAGGNILDITNPALCSGCTIDNSFAVPVLLRPGADPSNITITGNVPFPGAGTSSNTVNPGNAVLEYGGQGTININLPTQ
ncbi:MAG: hypothetical protein KC594_03080, partial [Nitrospira sp.]|nr:hypothetical protein [Nitrospira sp.]